MKCETDLSLCNQGPFQEPLQSMERFSKTGSGLPKLIQKNNEYPEEDVHHPFRSDVGNAVG